MNKDEYLERSRKLRMPQRCPLVGYCERWAWTIYFFNYLKSDRNGETIDVVLEREGELPLDYHERKCQLSVEAPQLIDGDDQYSFDNFCPEVPLFDDSHSPGIVPREAISSMGWTKPEGINRREHKHFSECLEYIQNVNAAKRKTARQRISPKLRFRVLQRDSFSCSYCGRSASDRVKLHVDHVVSVSDGGTNQLDNLVTSCDECNFGKGSTSVKLPSKPFE